MLAMQNRNKFAVAAADLHGNWTESSGLDAQMHYTNTGNYAGMNAISFNAEFWIEPKDSYRNQHKGACGMVGNQSFYQLEYKGRYCINGHWEVSFSNRHNGKTGNCCCQFEGVLKCRILHLQDKQATGMHYHLSRK
jgi:hypothetical protein